MSCAGEGLSSQNVIRPCNDCLKFIFYFLCIVVDDDGVASGGWWQLATILIHVANYDGGK